MLRKRQSLAAFESMNRFIDERHYELPWASSVSSGGLGVYHMGHGDLALTLGPMGRAWVLGEKTSDMPEGSLYLFDEITSQEEHPQRVLDMTVQRMTLNAARLCPGTSQHWTAVQSRSIGRSYSMIAEAIARAMGDESLATAAWDARLSPDQRRG